MKLSDEFRTLEKTFFETLMQFKKQEFADSRAFAFEGFAMRVQNDFNKFKKSIEQKEHENGGSKR